MFQKRFTRFVDAPKHGDAPFEVIFEDDNLDTRDTGNIDLPTI